MSGLCNFSSMCVLGLGYIGLPTAAMFAAHGIDVIGVDIDPQVVDGVNRGQIQIVEPELAEWVRQAVDAGRLRATTCPQVADAYLIAVPTPLSEDRRPDLRHVRAAALAIAPLLKAGDLLILESTSPVGTCQQLLTWLSEQRRDLVMPGDTMAADINLAYCPERVLPGRIVRELVESDRIIGGITPACGQRAAALYRLFVAGEMLCTDARTAEMVKLSENAFRDVNIAFANELSMLCEPLGIDVDTVIKLANRHPRVDILQPGCGVGGHCIAVDPWFIVDSSPTEARLIRTARDVNDHKPRWLVEQVEQRIQALSLADEEWSIACFGLSYKADSDDLRESPALKIALALALRYPGRVRVVEPHLAELPPTLVEQGIRLVSSEQGLICRILLRLVAHRQFQQLPWPQYGRQIIIDV